MSRDNPGTPGTILGATDEQKRLAAAKIVRRFGNTDVAHELLQMLGIVETPMPEINPRLWQKPRQTTEQQRERKNAKRREQRARKLAKELENS